MIKPFQIVAVSFSTKQHDCFIFVFMFQHLSLKQALISPSENGQKLDIILHWQFNWDFQKLICQLVLIMPERLSMTGWQKQKDCNLNAIPIRLEAPIKFTSKCGLGYSFFIPRRDSYAPPRGGKVKYFCVFHVYVPEIGASLARSLLNIRDARLSHWKP